MRDNRPRRADHFVASLPNLQRIVQVKKILAVAFIKRNTGDFPEVDEQASAAEAWSDTRLLRNVHQMRMCSPLIPHEIDAGMRHVTELVLVYRADNGSF